MTYTSGTVSANNPIVVRAWSVTGNFQNEVGDCAVTTNGGNYFLGFVQSGNYYITEEYVANPGGQWGNNNYAIGSIVQNSDGTCFNSGTGPTGFGNPTSISGAVTSNLTLSNACSQITGYTGTLTYTGIPSGNINNGEIYIEAVTTQVSDDEFGQSNSSSNNGGNFNLITGPGTYYLRVWYDSTGIAGQQWV